MRNHQHELFALCNAITKEGATIEELRAYAYSYYPLLRKERN